MFTELLQIFQGFETYDKINRSHWTDYMVPPRKGTTPSAFENYVKAKDEISDIMDRKRRFIEYLNHRRDLLDALQRSVIESNEEALQISVEKKLNKSIQQMADKTVRVFFR